jgi:hypothetical protein
MHQKARDRIAARLFEAKPEHRDFYLDQYLDCRDCATEWDAGHWGLDGSEFAKTAAAFDAFWEDKGNDTRWPAEPRLT